MIALFLRFCKGKTEDYVYHENWVQPMIYIFILYFLKFEFDSLYIIKQAEWLGHFPIHLIEENDKKMLFDM